MSKFENEPKEIRLKDLCQEDKTKIGDLIKKLAQEKEEKEIIKQ